MTGIDLEPLADAVSAEVGIILPPPPDRARFLRFLMTGAVAAAVNVAARYLLSFFLFYELAIALAYLVGMTTAFVLARLYVFDAAAGRAGRQYLKFALVNVAAFVQVVVVSDLFAYLLLPALGLTWQAETIAHLIGVASPVVTSYLAHKHFSFKS